MHGSMRSRLRYGGAVDVATPTLWPLHQCKGAHTTATEVRMVALDNRYGGTVGCAWITATEVRKEWRAVNTRQESSAHSPREARLPRTRTKISSLEVHRRGILDAHHVLNHGATSVDHIGWIITHEIVNT
jgi:hypothetical protein